jgi:HEAT repeat protein
MILKMNQALRPQTPKSSDRIKWIVVFVAGGIAIWLASRSPLMHELVITYLPDLGGIATIHARKSIGDHTLHNAAQQRITALGSRAVKPLINTLNDPDPQVRAQSAQALGILGSVASEGRPILLAMTDDPDADVRAATLSALRSVGASKEELLPRMLKALEDQDANVRTSGMTVLSGLSFAGPVDAKLLLGLLSSPYAEIRQEACERLQGLGSDAKIAFPRLEQMIKDDPSENVRHEAEEARELILSWGH